ncbi:16S rRNA (cytosine(1402)-N(4))-methyltransferase RsmH [Raineyella fluvialis]|uniref:Ribosomal RNA small subunit methyltransferase H n=1 Tax=Raineyella fluvialis TaxID=2662261 RepID=A0A5Q2FBR6_9ACTN|nr:16S rRNA (cytosine(1402)-N(4))-methyltransferase RsmH [Raineyella fluvialis]QGF24229.1 16S rRNA (cytosine(1402)-N(4))-methyltransferase RsmH [Raineyella fluvialis]
MVSTRRPGESSEDDAAAAIPSPTGPTDGRARPEAIHLPVMRDRIVELLAPALREPGAVFVDCTLGLGGHTAALLDACPGARAVGLDRDPDALATAGERLAVYGDRVTAVRAVYDEIGEVIGELGIPRVDAVLADLGLSSLQIDARDRGFAYAVDAPLDMRMGQEGPTAADVVNTYGAPQLSRILSRYGEERFADRIARAIVSAREQAPFVTSARLVEVIASAIPAAARHTGGHPAKRTFQALRIEVNRELEALEGMLPAALDSLAVGGRIAVLAYHSLEDRLVKHAFRDASTSRAPRDLPIVPEELQPAFTLLTKGAERPTDDETASNPRAASARLRAAQRIKES